MHLSIPNHPRDFISTLFIRREWIIEYLQNLTIATFPFHRNYESKEDLLVVRIIYPWNNGKEVSFARPVTTPMNNYSSNEQTFIRLEIFSRLTSEKVSVNRIRRSNKIFPRLRVFTSLLERTERRDVEEPKVCKIFELSFMEFTFAKRM